jgi:ketosteroid isomerase-like protein
VRADPSQAAWTVGCPDSNRGSRIGNKGQELTAAKSAWKVSCLERVGSQAGDVKILAATGEMDPSESMMTALRFNEKINQRDLEGLAVLMTDDHTFIDNSGEVTKGKDAMKGVWRDFFEKYPDYRNIFTSVIIRDGVVVMVGYSTCSYKPLDGPNVWTAKVRDGHVSEWRVYFLDRG